MAAGEEAMLLGSLTGLTLFVTYLCHRLYQPQLNRLLVQFISFTGASIAAYAWFIEIRYVVASRRYKDSADHKLADAFGG